MATRSARAYAGEDMTPVTDYTNDMIWEESEFGSRAYLGEGSASSIVIRDPLGEQGQRSGLPSGLTQKILSARNLFVVELGSDILFRGRVGIKNYSRDSQYVERYRQVECNLHDTNWDLDHIFVHNYARPVETDKARVQGLIASYLSTSPRPTTNINGSNFISSSNLVTLPAQTYTRSSPLSILRELSTTANKQFFVTGDTSGGGSLFWDGNESTAYACTLSISDRANEVNYTTVFPPIWNVGPAATEDGSEQLSQAVLFYGTGEDQYVVQEDAVTRTEYAHASETFTDDTVDNATDAQHRVNSIVAHRKYEDLTVNVTIGPLTDAQVVLVKHGQVITLKARATTFADDETSENRVLRIVQCRYTTPVVGTWFAHLQLGRPWKLEPYGKGPVLVPQPPTGASAASCTLDVGQMTAIATPNGDVESGSTNWSGGSVITYASSGGPVAGGGDNFFQQIFLGGNTIEYSGWTGLTFTAGTTYVVRGWHWGSGAQSINLGLAGVDEASYTPTGAEATTGPYWAFCLEWTPSSNRTGVTFRVIRAATGHSQVDNLALYTGSGGATSGSGVGTVGGTGQGTSGEPGTYMPIGSVLEHQNITTGGPYHEAADVTFTPNGSIAATDVQAAIQEVRDEAAAGAPTTADYLVGTAQAGLSAEIVVGTTPGGELGNTWASPTVDATHSGSSHAGTQSAAEATAAAALATHAATTHGGGEILITDTPAGSPLVFADLLQNEAGTDLLYEG